MGRVKSPNDVASNNNTALITLNIFILKITDEHKNTTDVSGIRDVPFFHSSNHKTTFLKNISQMGPFKKNDLTKFISTDKMLGTQSHYGHIMGVGIFQKLYSWEPNSLDFMSCHKMV